MTQQILKQILSLLKAPNVTVNIVCMKILRNFSSTPDVLKMLKELDLYDILDEIQVSRNKFNVELSNIYLHLITYDKVDAKDI